MRATLAFNSLIIKNDIITRFENFNHRSHFNKKCQRLAQINVLLKKTKFTLLKSIYFHFMTSTKQMLVFFRTRLGKILIWQKSSATWESDFKINIHVLNEFKVNHKDNRMTSFLYPLKTSENMKDHLSGVLIINFIHFPLTNLLPFLLTLNKHLVSVATFPLELQNQHKQMTLPLILINSTLSHHPPCISRILW